MIKQLPNLFTSLNLATGCIGVYYLFSGGAFETLYFVLVALFFDGMDGLLARLLNAKSAVGAQLDSLADMVSFGVLPGLYVLTLLKAQTSLFWIAILIVVFSAYRLAKFNIDDSQSDSFLGLPTPANAVMLTSLFLLSLQLNVTLLVVITLVSCFLLVAPIRLIALKFNDFSWSGNEHRWIVIIGCIILIIALRWNAITFLIPFYVCVSVIFGIRSNQKV